MKVEVTGTPALAAAIERAELYHRLRASEERLAAEEELRRQQQRAHHTVMDSQQREMVALRERAEQLAALCAELLRGYERSEADHITFSETYVSRSQRDKVAAMFAGYRARLAALGEG